MPTTDDPRWRLVLTELDTPGTRTKVGRLPNLDLKLGYAIGQPTSCTFRVRNDHRHVTRIRELSSFVKAYRLPAGADPSDPAALRFHGPVGPCRDILGADGWCEVTALSPRWYVNRRARQTARDWSGSTDKGTIVADLLDDEQTRRSLRLDTSGIGTIGASLTDYGIAKGRNVGEAIDELANTGDGFEFDEQPIDSDTGDMASLDIVSQLGTVNTSVFLEMEIRKRNVESAVLTSNVDRVASDLLGLGSGDIASTYENVGIADEFDALLDTVDTFGDIATTDALDALVERLAVYRVGPRRILTLQPKGSLTFRPFDDFDLGDIVNVRTPSVGRLVVDGAVRIWGFTIAVSANGEERLETLSIDVSGSV